MFFTYKMCILCSASHAVNQGSWFIVLNVLMLNVLRLNKWGLGSVADLLNTVAKALTSVEHALVYQPDA